MITQGGSAMGRQRGRNIPLSPMRRLMCDFLHFSKRVPMVAIERRLRISPLVAARRVSEPRPSWFALFSKAYAIVCEGRHELRRCYLPFPRARLYEHPGSVASLAIARPVNGQDEVMFIQLKRPERLPIADIDEQIRQARTEPLESLRTYRRQLQLARLPALLRRMVWRIGLYVRGSWRARYFGTFGITGVAALGSTSLHTLSPLTTTLTYGVIEPDGSVLVRLFYDHRVLDGVQPAEALRELEETLNGVIAQELKDAARIAA
jgi:hypothetical protein